MIYLITGGAGFIGSHLAWSLVQRGERVRLLDNFSSGFRETALMLRQTFHDSIEIVEGDIRDRDICRTACAGADYVLHYAAMASVQDSISSPELCAEINVGGTVNMLAAAHASGTVRRLIFSSSSAVYGDRPGASKREDARLDPLSPYASAKLAGESFCRNYAFLLGLETVTFRFFNVYGERQNPSGSYAAVIPKFIEALTGGEPPVIYGDGTQVRDFVYIDDVVQANLLGCTGDADRVSGEVFNIAGGRGTTLNRLLRELSRITGVKIAPRFEPARPGDIHRSVADIGKARALLGFEPKVGIEQGLRRVVAESLRS